MPLDIYGATSRRELGDYVASQPAVGPYTPVVQRQTYVDESYEPRERYVVAPVVNRPGLPPLGDLGELGTSFVMAVNANASAFGTLRALHNQANLVNDWVDAFEGRTGYRVDPWARALIPGEFDYDALNKAYQTEKTARTGFDLTPPPTREQAWQSAMDMERAFIAENERRLGQTAYGQRTGERQSLLSMTGSAIGTYTADTILLAPSMMAGVGAAGIVATAIRAGVGLAANQLAVSTAALPVRHSLNPDYGLSDVFNETLAVGAGGAVLGAAGAVVGAGIRNIAAAWGGSAYAGSLADWRHR